MVLKTVLMPAASNWPRIRSAIGDENGSSSDGYAAVFGRCAFGSERRYFTNGSPLLTTGAGCAKKTFGSFSWNTAGPPPDGSTNA